MGTSAESPLGEEPCGDPAPNDPTELLRKRRAAGGGMQGLSPSELKAYQSYVFAESTMDPPPKTDREAYDWLKESPAAAVCDLKDYDLPRFKTWVRYVREGRRSCGTQKNRPRAGRSSRHAARTDDL